MRDFHEKNYTADRIAVLGLNIDHEQAVNCGGLVGKSTGGPAAKNSQFHAGQEIRRPSDEKQAVLAVATGVTSAANVKEAVATRLLQYVLGFGEPKIKRGANNGKLSQALSNINGKLGVSALNYSYSDAGLLGATIVCESQV